MKISANKIRYLEEIEQIKSLYRVNNNYENIGIVKNGYIYYSSNIKHHTYYLIKKIFKYIATNYE